MKKQITMYLAPVFLGLSIQAYANNTVHFDIAVIYPQSNAFVGHPYYSVDTDLAWVPNRNPMRGSLLRYQATNQFGSAKIPYEKRQIRAGYLNFTADGKVQCAGKWEHDFWLDDEGKHDRFYFSIAPPCSVNKANDPGDKESGLHHSGNMYKVKAA